MQESKTRRRPRGPAPTGAVTVRDVAQHAGVSTTTASRALSGHSNVAEATRARVAAAADELGFVVNGLAQAMMGRGRRSVALVLERIIGPTFALTAAAAEAVVTEQGMHLVVSTTGGDPEREQDLIGTLVEQRIAAVILVGSGPAGEEAAKRLAGYARSLEAIGARLVLCGRSVPPPRPGIACVDYENSEPVREMIRRLWERGHDRIAMVGLRLGQSTSERRLAGYRQGLESVGLAADPELLLECGEGEDAVPEITAFLRRTKPTAVIALTDVIAVRVYHAAREAGLTVPGDLDVVGFDDAPLVGDLAPPLTTVHAPFYELGERATRIALGLDPDPGHLVLPSRLVLRESALSHPPVRTAPVDTASIDTAPHP
ncbi:MAG TPA: LacI family DNA-binding transcriptional regulator [Arachnia sp.]|nr:LacI family DNA-binding transcriptional regulator [Arachnia sp.]HMT86805.1 LacI family DNA-binding transcriptional regulator [Arachnia sp.]